MHICITHLLCDSCLLEKKAGAFTGKSGTRSSHGKILARAAPADDIHRRQHSAIEFCDIAHVLHTRKVKLCHQHGEPFDLAGPYRLDLVFQRRQRKAPDPIKEAPHRQALHRTTAARVRATLTAERAV